MRTLNFRKMKTTGKFIITCCITMASFHLKAQLDPGKIKGFIDSTSLSSSRLSLEKEVRSFYIDKGASFSWLAKKNSNDLLLLSKYIQYSSDMGLESQDYQPALFSAYAAGSLLHASEQDSLLTEIKFTDAAIHFVHDVLAGNRQEPLEYNGLNYTATCYDIPALLNSYLSAGRFPFLLNETESKETEYQLVKNKMNSYQRIMSTAGFKDAAVITSKLKSLNQSLIPRLYQLGFILSDTTTLDEPSLKAAIKKVQELFGIASNGMLNSTTLKALNISLARRVAELKYTLNTLRWLSCIKQGNHTVLVNIPSATLFLYERKKIVLESRVIVGKRSTATPTLCSKITEVILYPYWNVPYKIATQELLPAIKRNPGYVAAKNFQVLDMNGRVTNPSSINWQALGPGNFPYVLRQSTGCDNSLGLIKLNFYNPFSVYLHDTPGKSLFTKNNRYFSHGCMRLQKAMELGHYIVKGNAIAIDTLEAKGCLRNQSPITVPATEIIPVFVLYHTAWFDAAARLVFYEDVYDKMGL